MSNSYSESFSRTPSRESSPSSKRSSPSTNSRRSPPRNRSSANHDEANMPHNANQRGDSGIFTTPTARRVVDEEDDEQQPRYPNDDPDEPSQVVVSGVPISHNPDGSTTRVLSAGQFRQLFQQSIAKSHFHSAGGDSTTAASTPRRNRQGHNAGSTPATPHSHPRPPSAGGYRVGGSKAANRLRGAAKSTRPVHGTGRSVSNGSDRGFIDPYRCTKFRNVIHAPLPNSVAARVGKSHAPPLDYERTHAPGGNITSRREDLADERAEAYRKELVEVKHELARRDKQIESMKVKSQQADDNLSKVQAVMTRGRPQSEADALVHSMETLRGRNANQSQQITELQEQVYQLKLNTRASKVGELQAQCGMYSSEVQRLQAVLKSMHPSQSANGSPARNRNGGESQRGPASGPGHATNNQHVGALQEKIQSLREDVRLAESESAKWKSLYNAEKPRIAEAQKRMNELKSAPTEIYRLKTELETTAARLRDTQNQLSAHLEVKSSEQSGMRGTVEQLVAERDRLARQLKDNETVAAEQRKNMAQRERELDADVAKRARVAVEEERALGADREKVLRNQINDLKAQVQTLEELNKRQKCDHESDIAKLKLLEQQRQENLLSTVNKHEKEREQELIRGVEDRERDLQRQLVSLQEEKREWDSQANILQKRLDDERASHNTTKQKLQRVEQQVRVASVDIGRSSNNNNASVVSTPVPIAKPAPPPRPTTPPAYEPPTFVNEAAVTTPATPARGGGGDPLSENSLRRGGGGSEVDPNAETQTPADVKTTRYHRQDDLMSEVTVQIRRPNKAPEESEAGRNSPGSLHLDGSMMPMSGFFEEASTRVEPKLLNTSAMAESISSAESSAKLNATATGANNTDGGVAVMKSATPTPSGSIALSSEKPTPKEKSIETHPVPAATPAASHTSSILGNPLSAHPAPAVPSVVEDDDPPLPRPNPIAGMVTMDEDGGSGGALDFGEDGSMTQGDIVTDGTPRSSNAPLFEVESDSSGDF